MSEIRFDDHVVVVTGAGRGLGAAYAKFFASRGAKVVVNDLGTSLNGSGSDVSIAKDAVRQIHACGGIAVADYNSVEDGDRIIETAINTFGGIHVLINNAGIAIPDALIGDINDHDWNLATTTYITGMYRTTHAAWKHFVAQKYGRIINTSSLTGYAGKAGNGLSAAMHTATVSFAGTLEKEGRDVNIKVNSIIPTAVTRSSASKFLYQSSLTPDWVVPIVATLAHSSNKRSGLIFEAGAGHFGRLRWEQNGGICLPADENLTPDTVLQNWDQIRDFTQGLRHLDGAEWIGDRIEKVKNLPGGDSAPQKVDFSGRVVLVTGGGQGLGRSYCHLLAKLGAIVAVNDLHTSDTASVVQDIKNQGGEAISINISVEQGDLVVQKVIDTYGRIDVVINNAGITRDHPFDKMNDKSWFDVINCHLLGTYKITKAAWPHMVAQKYGRFVNTISAVGLYGNWHQSNYCSAKGGIIGLTRVMASEGAEHNILANCLAPYAFTNMLKQYMGEELGGPLRSEYVAALSVLLVSDEILSDKTGQIYEAGCGWFAAVRLQRSRGIELGEGDIPSPEVITQLDNICDFTESQYPEIGQNFSNYAVA